MASVHLEVFRLQVARRFSRSEQAQAVIRTGANWVDIRFIPPRHASERPVLVSTTDEFPVDAVIEIAPGTTLEQLEEEVVTLVRQAFARMNPQAERWRAAGEHFLSTPQLPIAP